MISSSKTVFSVLPEVVLAGCLGGIDQRMVDEFEDAGLADDTQLLGMNCGVVVAAQHDSVVGAGGATG